MKQVLYREEQEGTRAQFQGLDRDWVGLWVLVCFDGALRARSQPMGGLPLCRDLLMSNGALVLRCYNAWAKSGTMTSPWGTSPFVLLGVVKGLKKLLA